MKHTNKTFVTVLEKKIELSNMRDYYERSIASPMLLSLLDNSLISQTNTIFYNLKYIICGDYIQIYRYNKTHYTKDINLEELKPLNDINFSSSKSSKINNINSNRESAIDYKNIIRSKLSLERLVKSNISLFKSFITLTFKDNITNIKDANKTFNVWRTRIKKDFNNFSYICVPEFQKRGAIHYHLLTNIDLKNTKIIIPQKDRVGCYNVKYWNSGFSSVFDLKDINVIGYISKYMTKDIDNRLFGKHRYFYSQNLKKPNIIYFNDDLSGADFLTSIMLLNDTTETYNSIYTDNFNNIIEYSEHLKGTSYNIY